MAPTSCNPLARVSLDVASELAVNLKTRLLPYQSVDVGNSTVKTTASQASNLVSRLKRKPRDKM